MSLTRPSRALAKQPELEHPSASVRKFGRRLAVLSCLCALSLSGCGSLGMEASLGAAQIRFVQVSPGSPEMDLYVNGTGAAYGLGFASFTSYLPVSSGVASLGVTKAGSGQTMLQAQSSLVGGHQYTAVVSHGLGNLQSHVYPDQDTPAPQGDIALRVLNEVETTGTVNVYIVPTSGGVAGPSAAAVFSLAPGAAGGYVVLPAGGSYLITATMGEGALSFPIGTISVKAVSGAVRTVVFAGSVQAGGHGVVGFALEDVNPA